MLVQQKTLFFWPFSVERTLTGKMMLYRAISWTFQIPMGIVLPVMCQLQLSIIHLIPIPMKLKGLQEKESFAISATRLIVLILTRQVENPESCPFNSRDLQMGIRSFMVPMKMYFRAMTVTILYMRIAGTAHHATTGNSGMCWRIQNFRSGLKVPTPEKISIARIAI